jgi:tetratricopeptide (TPR) repeat protein
MVQNADLLDEHFANMELVNWIEDECALPELSKKLKGVLRTSIKPESFVRTILEEICYIDEKEMKELERVIRSGRLLSRKQREKVIADYFFHNKHYALAHRAYEEWLKNNEDADSAEKAAVYKCLGNVYARLFYFADAAKMFDEAYQLCGDEDALLHYLLSKRMELDERGYLNFVKTLPEDQPMLVDAEKQIEKAMEEYKKTESYQQLAGLEKMKLSTRRQDFEEISTWYVDSEMDSFRECMVE